MKFHVNDTVVVIAGKDKGKSGTVTRLDAKNNRVIVEGVNKRIKHVKGRDGNPGERAEFFAPIHVSNVAIVDPKTKKPTRIGYRTEKAGGKVRIAKASGEILAATAKTKAKAAPKSTEKK